jgi:hypothetical protein
MSANSTRSVLIFRGLQLASYGITTLLIPISVNSAELGVYYLFISLLGAQVLFELGLNQAALQISSHITNKGSNKYKEFVIWIDYLYKKISIRYFLVGGFLGSVYLLFFNEFDQRKIIFYWVILVFSSALLMRISYRFTLIEAEGLVSSAYLARASILLTSSIISWFFILNGLGLESLLVFYLAQALLAHGILFRRYPIKSYKAKDHFFNDYSRELGDLQTKFGISYLAGYLSYNSIVPIVFSLISDEAAGQVGLTFAIFSSLTLLSSSFASAKNHDFAAYIARRNYFGLNILFKKQFFLTIALAFSLLLILLLLIANIEFLSPKFSDRILPLSYCLLVGLSAIASSVIYAMAIYVRAHKEEPFVAISIFSGLTSVILIFFGSYFGVFWAIFLYSFSILFVALPLTTIIFSRFYLKNSKAC